MSGKVTTEQGRFLLAAALTPSRLSIAEAIRMARALAEKKGISLPNERECRQFLNDWKERNFDTWTFYREGKKGLMKMTEESLSLQGVDKELVQRLYKRRGKLERACDKAMAEVHDLLLKMVAEVPLKVFEENGLSKIGFYIEIRPRGNVFSYTLKHEVA